MQDLYFYPKLTPELKEACGYSSDKYIFSYEYQGEYHGLRQKGSSTLKLSDPLEIWKIETEGIRINKNVRIAYPQFLYGKDGIAEPQQRYREPGCRAWYLHYMDQYSTYTNWYYITC